MNFASALRNKGALCPSLGDSNIAIVDDSLPLTRRTDGRTPMKFIGSPVGPHAQARAPAGDRDLRRADVRYLYAGPWGLAANWGLRRCFAARPPLAWQRGGADWA